MTRWLVTRHPGALAWAAACGMPFDRHVEHLDPAIIKPGDTVMGTLPVNLAAEVCARGARYLHLTLPVAQDMRGRELSQKELAQLGARLEEYRILRCDAGTDRAEYPSDVTLGK